MSISYDYVLASYPRSGNTWTRYIIEWFSGRPTLGAKEPEDPSDKAISGRICGFLKKNDIPIAAKRHYAFHLNKYDFDKDIILIIRNYKESIVRHLPKVRMDKELLKKQTNLYMEMLGLYDVMFNRKHIIFYEDLIINTNQIIKDLLKFMNIYQEEKLTLFIKNIEKHKQNCIDLYTDSMAPSATKGKETIHHSKRLTKTQRKEWDDYIKTKWNSLYERYLLRYLE